MKEQVSSIDLTSEQLHLVRELLREHIPHAEVWAYGSRVKWTSTPKSDLDMVAHVGKEARGQICALREAFEESSLPFRVDLFVWDDVPVEFHAQIERAYFVIQAKNKSSICVKTTLGQVLNFRRGHDLPKSKMRLGDIPVAGSNGCIGYHDSFTPISPCITIGRSGNIGIPYFYHQCWAHNTTLYIDNFKGNNPLFLYYYIKTLKLEHYASGSAVPTLNRNHIHPLDIDFIADLQTQKQIAHVLSTIDKKIELNQRINENLEQQAYILYKHIFSSQSLPQGKLSDLGMIIGGSTPSKSQSEYYARSGIAWITPKDLSINKSKFISKGTIDITEKGYKSTSLKMLPQGTVLFSSRAPIGYIAIADNEVTTNQGFKSVVPHSHIGTPYIYYLLKSNLALIESMSSGSTFNEVSASTMRSLRVAIPNASEIRNFNYICQSIFEKQKQTERENRHLTALRDTLLPKLMSGEIDVSQVKI